MVNVSFFDLQHISADCTLTLLFVEQTEQRAGGKAILTGAFRQTLAINTAILAANLLGMWQFLLAHNAIQRPEAKTKTAAPLAHVRAEESPPWELDSALVTLADGHPHNTPTVETTVTAMPVVMHLAHSLAIDNAISCTLTPINRTDRQIGEPFPAQLVSATFLAPI